MLFFSDCPQRLRVVRDLWRVVRDLWRVDRDLWWVVRDLCTHRQPWLERGELVRDLWSIVRDLYLVDQYLGKNWPWPVVSLSETCGGSKTGSLWRILPVTWRSVACVTCDRSDLAVSVTCVTGVTWWVMVRWAACRPRWTGCWRTSCRPPAPASPSLHP